MIFSICLCMCVFSTHLSVSLKCLTVLSCPQSVKSREVETSKKGKCDEEKVERRKQRQEVLLGIFCNWQCVCFHFLYLLWCCVIVIYLAAVKTGRGQQTSLWGGHLRIQIWPHPLEVKGQLLSLGSLMLKRCKTGQGKPCLKSYFSSSKGTLEHSPASQAVGLRWCTTPSKWGEGFEGWTNSHNRAALGGHRQRETLSGQQEASQFFFLLVNRTPAGDKLSLSVTLIWLCLLHCFFSFGHTHFLPQTGNGRSIWWLSRDSEAPFLPHTSPFLTPPSLLPPSSSVIPPSLCHWVFAFSAFGRCVHWTEQQRWQGGGDHGSDRLKRKQTWGMNPYMIYPSINLTSFSKTLLFLSAWNTIGFAATHALYRPHPLCI